jgi:hypothetical protein
MGVDVGIEFLSFKFALHCYPVCVVVVLGYGSLILRIFELLVIWTASLREGLWDPLISCCTHLPQNRWVLEPPTL